MPRKKNQEGSTMSFRENETTQKGAGGRGQRLRVLLTIALAATLSLSLLAGCQPKTTEPTTDPVAEEEVERVPVGPVTFTDDLGYEITVEDPERVVATMGSLGKIWELAGGTLIGISDDVDTYSGYALSSLEVARVGDFTSIDLEKVLALEPDFVILTAVSTGRGGTANQLDFKETLEASGITVAYFEVTTFQDYLRMLNYCTQITGRSDLFRENGADVKSKIETYLSLVPANEHPSVLLITTYSGGSQGLNSSTQTGSMLSFLGAKNMTDANPSLLSTVSLEAIIEANPDFIFVQPRGVTADEAVKILQEFTDHPAWSELDAVKNGNFIVLDSPLFLYKPLERWDEAYTLLFGYLYA